MASTQGFSMHLHTGFYWDWQHFTTEWPGADSSECSDGDVVSHRLVKVCEHDCRFRGVEASDVRGTIEGLQWLVVDFIGSDDSISVD